MAAFTADKAGYKRNMMLLGEIYQETLTVDAGTVLREDLGQTTDRRIPGEAKQKGREVNESLNVRKRAKNDDEESWKDNSY